jgi:hypothetical protein
MKKQYWKPEIEVIKLELKDLLRVSGDLGDDADEPARARMFNGEFDGDWDDSYEE